MTLKTFFKECNEKEVLKMLSIYIVSSWVLIQVLAVTWEPLGIPKESVTFLIIALLIGLPVYIFYIWKIRLAPLEKLKPTRVSKKGKPKRSGFQKTYFSILGIVSLLSLVAVAFIVENNFFKSAKLPKQIASDKIAILKFGNNTGDHKNDIVGKMTSDWIMHGITQNKLGQVVSPEIVTEYVGFLQTSEEKTDDKSVLNTYFKPGKVISGNYYLDNDKLLFQCSITDGDYDKTLISFKPISCEKGKPLECIESLKQVILGFLITEETPELNLQETPPKFAAYQYFIDAKDNYANPEIYIDLLNKAVAADSNYFEANVDRVLYYYNSGKFKIADSLIRVIKPNSRNNIRQINLLNEYQALLAGDNKKAQAFSLNEYSYAPFHMETNSGVMVLTLQYVNKPEAIDSMFTTIPMSNLNLDNCTFCLFRYYIQALAQNELRQYDKTEETLAHVIDQVDDYYLKIPLISAFIRSDNFAKLDGLLSRIELEDSVVNLKRAYLLAGKECLLSNKEEMAKLYFNKIIALETEEDDKEMSAMAYYYGGSFNMAQPLLKELQEQDPNNESLLSKLAVCYQKSGDKKKSEELLEHLEAQRAEFQFGAIDYALAQFYTAVGDQEAALKNLLQSVAAGNNYTPVTFQNDPHFKEYRNHPTFKNIMNFWH